VDVLVTHRILREGFVDEDLFSGEIRGSDLTEQVTETLLQNIRVMAVDQRATSGIEDGEGIPIPRSVSLEVTPEDAQRVRLAGEVGRLSLALRSLEAGDEGGLPSLTRPKNLSQYDSGSVSAREKEQEPVRVIRGTSVE
jgi:pilus assembly protein CpaB